jgi:hypothetical protein
MTRNRLSLLLLTAALTTTLGACSHRSADHDADDTDVTIEGSKEDGVIVVHNDGDVTITGDNTAETRALNGQDVQVVGSGNKATFTGRCGEITVMGAGNQVAVENVTSLNLVGSNNTVTWRGKEPEINNLGQNNRVVQAK